MRGDSNVNTVTVNNTNTGAKETDRHAHAVLQSRCGLKLCTERTAPCANTEQT